MMLFSFLRKRENKKVKSILESEKWTKINVQKRIPQKSLENRNFEIFYLLFFMYSITHASTASSTFATLYFLSKPTPSFA